MLLLGANNIRLTRYNEIWVSQDFSNVFHTFIKQLEKPSQLVGGIFIPLAGLISFSQPPSFSQVKRERKFQLKRYSFILATTT